AAPATGDGVVVETVRQAGARAPIEAAAVVSDEVAEARARSHRVDACVEAVAAGHGLPLRRAGRGAGEADHARRIVLSASGRRRIWRGREVAADIARIEL